MFAGLQDQKVFVIHCAGAVDIAAGYSQKVYDVNVPGTQNVVRQCAKNQAKLVYITSVHARPPVETKDGIEPALTYNPDAVAGLYAKVKAQASRIVLDAVRKGLHACIIQPSGLIGPNDYSNSNLTQFLTEAANEKLPACVKEGYSFVDVRDAASAIVQDCQHGKNGVSYIVAGPEISMMKLAALAAAANHSKPVRLCVPISLVEAVTPLTTLYYRYARQNPLFTSFAVQTLKTPSNFNTRSAEEDLGFSARPIEQTVADTIAFQKGIFRFDTDAVIENGTPVNLTGNSNTLLKIGAAAAGLLILGKLFKKRS